MSKNKTRNAFFFFMQDWKKRQEKLGHRYDSLHQVQSDPKCSEAWKVNKRTKKINPIFSLIIQQSFEFFYCILSHCSVDILIQNISNFFRFACLIRHLNHSPFQIYAFKFCNPLTQRIDLSQTL